MAWKILNLWRKPASKGQLTNEKYLPYGYSDNFPLQWADTIQSSPSASSCLSTIQDFLEGFGFSNTDLEKKQVNAKGETLFQIHQKTVDSFSEFEGFYWLVKYNALGQITEWEVLPFENCRLGKPDDNGYIGHIFYNPFFGTTEYRMEDKKQTKVYNVFNPKAVKDQILEQKDKFKGQIFYYGTTTATSPYYPKPEAHVAWRWMKIESGISDYHEDNINNGFLQPLMLAMIGNPDAPSTNPEYTSSDKPMTVAEEFDEVIAQNFMGAKRVGNLWVNWFASKEEVPQVIAMPSNNNGDLFVTLDNQATKKITIAWKVPAILANIHEGVSLGGDGNTLRVAVKLMQHRVVKKQRILTDNYKIILRNLVNPITEDIVIVPYNPYPELEVIDDKIWNEMSREERRKWIQDNTEIELDEATEIIEQPTVTENRFNNAIPIGFPENVRKQVKRTLDYIEKMGIRCSSKGGLEVAKQILDNKSMGLKQLKRIHSYLKKNVQYSDSEFSNGCAVIEYNVWGGKDMLNFLDSKLNDINAWLN